MIRRQYAVIATGPYNELKDAKKHPNVYVGTGAYIGPGVKFVCKDVWVGDYTKIHDNTLICGDKDFKIGHNCWVGGGCILDTRGGLTIGNGVGIGAGSQLWSHIRFGDMLQGCMWNSEKPMIIEDDVWFVGHCLVSPIYAYQRSMALLGSVVTHDMEHNIVYGGNPAKVMKDYTLRQFHPKWLDSDRWAAQEEMFQQYYSSMSRIQYEASAVNYNDFNPIIRTYIKRNTLAQHQFMKWAVPLYKYNPVEEGVE